MDDALITAAQRGDADATEALLVAARPVVACRVYHVLGRGDPDADDTIQTVLVKVWRRLDTFTGGNFVGWLNRVATNACYDLLRSRRRAATVSWEGLELLDDADPLDHALIVERRENVRRAVALLGGHYAPALMAVDLGGLEYTEAATLLGVKMGTLKSRVHRGRQALATMLEE
jgi:RNA polymerase sigma-70 factor (ECF subfamily)